MFQTHINKNLVKNSNHKQDILFFAVEGVITHSYNDLHIQHCKLISDIEWDNEHLCATVFLMDVELALFIMNNIRFFPINKMVIVAEPEVHNSDLAMISAERIDPVSFLQIDRSCEDRDEPESSDDE